MWNGYAGTCATQFDRSPTCLQRGQANSPALVQANRVCLSRSWLPHDLATPLIAVNVPAFRLYGFDEPHVIGLKMNVVIGKAMRSETPAFIGSMTYRVFRPDWGVPPIIVRREILPPLQKDPSYLSKNGYTSSMPAVKS